MLEIALPRPADGPPPKTGCIVAIDAGATKTAALALDLQRGERRSGRADAGNPESVGLVAATEHVLAAAEAAAADSPITAMLVACAGTSVDDLRGELTARAPQIRHLDLVNDVIGAWGAATGGEDGIALICGTGSHAVGVAGDRALRVGGWGHIFGDEGSAWELGRAALAARLRMLDGRADETPLAAMLDAQLGDPQVAVPELYRSPNLKSQVAALAQVVDAAQRAGDPVAAQIIEQAAADLAGHIAALGRALPFDGSTTIGLVGSTWKAAALLEAFQRHVAALELPVSGAPAAPTAREPVEGTLILLQRALGLA